MLNWISLISLLQWKQNKQYYEKDVLEKNEILRNLSEGYDNEKTANTKLISENEELRNQKFNLKKENERLKVIIRELEYEVSKNVTHVAKVHSPKMVKNENIDE